MNQQQIGEQRAVFADYLKRKGLKMTRQREVVVDVFLGEDGHLSADELHLKVRKIDSRIGLATVFRTLKTLTDCGLAREIDLGDGRARFEHDYRRPHHHHLVCEQCQKTIEFHNPEFERLHERIVSQYGFKPLRHHLQIFGLCRECQNDETADLQVFDSNLVFARDALKIAMATEERGVNFYRAAADIVSDETTRSTFLEMLEEEKSHLRGLEKEWDRLIAGNKDVLEAPVFLHFDYDALRQIFPSGQEVRSRLSQNMSASEALRMAMDMEREAHQFFSRYASRFNDTKGRDIFLKFAEEEQEHFDLIKREFDRLNPRAEPSEA